MTVQTQVLDAEYVDIDRISTDTWDSREEPKNKKEKERLEKHYQELLASIRTDGIRVPIMVARDGKDYEIIGGRHRLKAAKELGLKQVPISIHDDLKTEVRKRKITGVENFVKLGADDMGKARWVVAMYEAAGYKIKDAESGVKSIDNYFSNNTGATWENLTEVTSVKIHKDTNPLRKDKAFVELCKSIPFAPKYQYQLITVVSKLHKDVQSKAARAGLRTDKQILLTTGPLPEHPVIQKALIDRIKDMPVDNARETVHQTVKDLRSGYLRRSKPDSDFYVLGNSRPKEDEDILPPISIRIIEINTAIGKYLFQMTDKAITKGVEEYNPEVVKATRNFRLEVLKTLDERNMINFYNNLKLVKLVTDDAIKMVKEELETIDKKNGMTGR